MQAEGAPRSRIQSVDALRGLIMIIMALDHVRDFFHSAASQFQPDDLTRTTTVLFFTRWITHYCAPVFFFTAGIGAYFGLRGRTKGQLSSFLVKRGLWLVLLELTVLRLGLNFELLHGAILLTILWALGWSMVALGALVWVPTRVLAIVSIAVIALHNLADGISAERFGGAAWVWNIVHQQGVFAMGTATVVAAYPLIPWIFVMSAGFCFGTIVELSEPERRRWMLRIGGTLTIAFVVIRAINVYGDLRRWAVVPGMTVLSFLRVTKQPPSLDFLLMTLGPAILLLAWFGRFTLAKTNPLVVFGRVPLFYFLCHLFLGHALMIPFALLRYGHAGFLFGPLLGEQYPPGYGYDLWVVYAVWIAVVGMLYPLCLWFARVKERRRDWWLSYL
jgi:uncharacterized membrane protein